MPGLLKYTMCLKNAPTFLVLNNSVKIELISLIFGVEYPEEILHQKIRPINSPPHLNNVAL